MSKFATKIAAVSAMVLGAALLSGAASAGTTPLGNLDPDNAGSYSETDPTGAIDVEGTFTLTVSALTALSATIAVTGSGDYSPGELELWKSGVEVDHLALTFNGSQYTASFSELIGAGSYSAVITGTVNADSLGVGGSVTTSSVVPEPSTWAMLMIGFAGLGYAAFRRSTKDRAAGVAV